ncbi:MAG: hypothetical protein WBD20_10200 [Pirellulaceae bacterium]
MKCATGMHVRDQGLGADIFANAVKTVGSCPLLVEVDSEREGAVMRDER